MNRGMANLLRWLELPEEQVWSMGTRSPAKVLRFAGRGHLVAGMAADVVLWEDGEDLTAAATWVGGRKVFNHE